jgi:hypothetical protein
VVQGFAQRPRTLGLIPSQSMPSPNAVTKHRLTSAPKGSTVMIYRIGASMSAPLLSSWLAAWAR